MKRNRPLNPVLDYAQVPALLEKAERKHRSKYGAIRTKNADGTMSDSRKEARWDAIIMQAVQRAGNLRCERKERFPFVVDGGKQIKASYEADWTIYDIGSGELLAVIDCKGFKTPVYKLKKKLFEAQYMLPIIEDLAEMLKVIELTKGGE